MNTLIKTLFFACFFSLNYASLDPINKKVVVLDLHGVVLTSHKKAALQALGLKNILFYIWQEKISPHRIMNVLKGRLYQLMGTIKPLKNNSEPFACDDHGQRLPQHMINFLDGSQSSEEILQELTTFIKGNPTWFKSRAEQIILFKLVTLLFTPELFAKLYIIRPEALTFVKECIKNGYTVAILSNFDTKTFEIIKNQYADFFNLFDDQNICISAITKASKPHKEIYTFFDQFNVAYNDITFIDDQYENLIIPKEKGVNVVHFKTSKRLGGLLTRYPAFPQLPCLLDHNPSLSLAIE